MNVSHHVIIGGGLAAARAAEGMRAAGFSGAVTIVAGEPDYPYIRPPLSKEYLSGSAERASIFVHDDDWYAEHDVRVLRGQAVAAIALDDHRLLVGEPLEDDVRVGRGGRAGGGAGERQGGEHQGCRSDEGEPALPPAVPSVG